MPDWDEDSPTLRQNLARVLDQIRSDSRLRSPPALSRARAWLSSLMQGPVVPDPAAVGRFRGEPGIENCEVAVGTQSGVPAPNVGQELAAFENKLRAAVSELDRLIPPDKELQGDDVAAIVKLCAWAHAEWVRIHPFANGNGRTARLWANSLAMRYRLPPFVRLRPRPDAGYEHAGAKAMSGDWRLTELLFRRMLSDFLDGVR